MLIIIITTPDDKKHIACEKVRFICQFYNTKLISNKKTTLILLACLLKRHGGYGDTFLFESKG